MTTDNRTSEPTPEQVEAAAKAMHGTGNPWFAAYGDWGAAGFEIKKAFRESARAALLAATTIPQPVLDPEKVAALIESERDRAAAERDFVKESLGQFMAPALCEAYTEGKLTK